MWLQLKTGPDFTAPYPPDAAADRLVVTMAKPVYEDGRLLGVVGVDKSLEAIIALLDREKASERGHSFFFTGDGEIVVHSEEGYEEPELTNLCSVLDCGLLAQPRGLCARFCMAGTGICAGKPWKICS